MKKLLLTITLLTSFHILLFAKHIVGGEITYECNGGGGFTFTINMYRDCSSGGAELDDPAKVTIYVENATGGYDEVDTLDVSLSSTANIPPPDDPCTELPPLCVQRGIYTFSRNLPDVGRSYHIVYQRCCRNNTIANLDTPGDQGATFTMELTPTVVNLNTTDNCSSSPAFNEFPPTVICVDKPINFDHSATDPDGDQLVYSFCSPLQGGGLVGSPGYEGDPNGCDGVTPNPGCPPPYDNVNFAFPTYSATNPMGGDPIVSVDANTGFISGVPNTLGQYVVGVCVEEYRNGELLSIVRRDFQFNVTTCNPVVEARIESDDQTDDGIYVVRSCGDYDVQINNLSVQQSNIFDYRWEFDTTSNGEVDAVLNNVWSPLISFSDTGTYSGTLYLNPNTECADTAYLAISVSPEVHADFSFEYDTCVADVVTFTDASYNVPDMNLITEWSWRFGDDSVSTDKDPTHLYSAPGNFPVSLTVTDLNLCTDTKVENLPYFPVPELIVVDPSTFTGCAPADIVFDNLSSPVDSSYTVTWAFGDGTISNAISPTHRYNQEGVYTVSTSITSPLGCYVSDTFYNYITVLASPKADFSYTPEELTNFNNTADFLDASTDPIYWYWVFGDLGDAYDQNPSFTFADTGRHEVTLYVTHESGCVDSITKILDVIPKVNYFLPNAFTPNNDDLNDEFMGVGYFEGMKDFNFRIWDRWGELVFETKDPYIGWNGRKKNSGKKLPNGVYMYEGQYSTPRNEYIRLKGFATLIR